MEQVRFEKEADVRNGIVKNGEAWKQHKGKFAVVKASAYLNITGMSSDGKGGVGRGALVLISFSVGSLGRVRWR